MFFIVYLSDKEELEQVYFGNCSLFALVFDDD